MTLLIELIARIIEKCGRKWVRMTRRGDLLFERYCPIFPNRHPGRNLMLHRIYDAFADDYAHDHGRATLSIILSGGYTEHKETGLVKRRRFSVSRLRWDEAHNISDVLPRTWTLFLVGREHREPHLFGTENVMTRTEAVNLDKGQVAGLRLATPELMKAIARRKEAVARLRRRNSVSPTKV